LLFPADPAFRLQPAILVLPKYINPSRTYRNQTTYRRPHQILSHILGLIMVTGIETAGLVLGAFPLAIEGIKAYSDGMKTVKDMKNYEQILRQFARELKVERCKYDNTFLGLLTELVGPAKASRMKTDLQGDGWNDEDFRSQLKAQMGPAEETLDNWLYVAKQLNETLSTVCEKFKLSPEQEKKVLPPVLQYMCTLYIALFADHDTST